MLPNQNGAPAGENSEKKVVRYYKRRLNASTAQNSLEGVEADADQDLDLSREAINDRLGFTRDNLHLLIKNNLAENNSAKAEALEAVANRLIKQANRALNALADGNEQALQANPSLLEGLEGIVRTDGSRPSFMIRDGNVDQSTSPVGIWGQNLDASSDSLKKAIACVGRIDTPKKRNPFQGTGFLVGPNVIITNRHVLQSVATFENNGEWKFSEDAAIDFGHEFRANDSLNRRVLKRVLFAGSKPIDLQSGFVDHAKLDIAVIELEPGEPHAQPLVLLAVDEAADWPRTDLPVYTIGYPAQPPFGVDPFPLLEMLFQSTFGYKRLAPGLIMQTQANLPLWSQAHDATTLGGNSGSVVLVAGRENAVAALHYGGRIGQPRENWGHVFGSILRETNGVTAETLSECLQKQEVNFTNRTVG